MDQLEMLWLYQQEDMACDKMEHEIKRSPNRLKLIKNRDFLLEQQNSIKKIETEVSEMSDRLDVLVDAINRCNEQLAGLQGKFEANEPQSLDEAKQMEQEVKRLQTNIASYEAETRKMKKDANDRDHRQRDIRLKAARVKAEFDELKVKYDVEYKQQVEALDKQRAIAQGKANGISQELLDRYRAIKLHCIPPMARLQSDQCGGCNMSLPSVVLRNIKSGSAIECENCGRMLIQ